MTSEEKKESPLVGIHVAVQSLAVAIRHTKAAQDAAAHDLNPEAAAKEVGLARRALDTASLQLKSVVDLLSGKEMPIPPGPDPEENVFRRDFARALMAGPSNYFSQTWSGRESSLFSGGSATSLVGIVGPPEGFELMNPEHVESEEGWMFPTPEVWKNWLARTIEVASHMPGVHVPKDGPTRGVRAPWNPLSHYAFRVPGIVRDVAAQRAR